MPLIQKPAYQNLGERRKTKGKTENGWWRMWAWDVGSAADSVDVEILGLFTSSTDKACFGDLFNSKCFFGEAEKSFEEFLSYNSWTSTKTCHFDTLII